MNRPIRLLLPALLLFVVPATTAGAQTAKTLTIQPRTGVYAGKQFYTNSHALIVGIRRYQHLPKSKWLDYADKDATDLRDVLIRSYGFLSENVTLLVDEKATKANIEGSLARFANDTIVKPDDRVLVFFSGHGQTVKKANGGDIGFIIPYDADVDLAHPENRGPYVASCLAMDQIWSDLEASPAKHALLLADACYGGLLAKGRQVNEKPNPAVIANLLTRPAQQVLTAGGKDEEAFEDPKLGHGAFTYKLLEELRARASSADEVFLASDLASSLKVSVGNITNGKQTPQFGNHETEGEFLFVTTEPKKVPVFEAPLTVRPIGGSVKIDSAEAQLSLVTDPPGARIFIDGKDTGQVTPADLTYNFDGASKDFQLRLELPNYRVITGKVTLEIGKRTTVDQKLKEIVAQGISQVAAGKSKTNAKDGAEMIFIPTGDFLMGDDDRPDNPRRKVTLSGYWMYKNLVTVGMYKKFCADAGHKMPPAPNFNANWSKEDHPIVRVSWDDATAYCVWAGVSLPTEAQWEKAARGTEGLKYPWGNDYDLSKVWASKSLNGDSGGTTAVGHYGVSPYGCTDMSGNVWQWCRDWYDEKYWSGRQAEGVDPENQSVGEKKDRSLRGGSWYTYFPGLFRAANRLRNVPALIDRRNGFRCASGPN